MELGQVLPPAENNVSSKFPTVYFCCSVMKCLLFLSQLTEVNDSMAEYTAGFNLGQPNATQLHTLQRHRDILQGYSHEFSKTKVKFP